ncbi:MAG: porin [Anaeromyxobacter sp.]|nr:porin [Anaeromyxobacter sp.]MBL0275555.1 porin [Anaeromyxobacter sp.]
MTTRFIALTAALALAPAAFAADEAVVFDPTALEGKVDSLAEQYAETKNDVLSMKRLKLSGYIQARYAWLEAASYNGSAGATAPTTPTNNGLFIRRGRFKTVYDADWSQYTIQIDVIPSGLSMKEGYATVKLPMGMAIDAGLQLFPFGYEVFARSSSDLDTLERSRVTSAFLGGEYDLGVALKGKLSLVNFKVGLFNGNGVNSGQLGRDNDQLKDVIGRAWVDMGVVTAGLSGWYGKTINYARADDKAYDRNRVAVDAQLYLDLLPFGGTALKGEYMWGHTTIGNNSGNLGAGGNLPNLTSAAPVATGSGFYAMVVQNIAKPYQLAVKYEQYMPNHTVDISAATSATVKVQKELQVALHAYLGGNYKLSAAYYHPMNGEKGAAAASDPKADQFILQAQAKF